MRCSTSLVEVTSVVIAVAAPPKSRAACSSLSVDRAATTRSAPASASARATASPIPEEAPVTTATFPESDLSIVGPECLLGADVWSSTSTCQDQQLDL